jgi:hypothetical protein
MTQILNLIITLLLLMFVAWVFDSHAAENDPRLRGLTPTQRAQATNPSNPQFTPPEIWRAEPRDDTVYVVPRIPSDAEKADAILRQAPVPRAIQPPVIKAAEEKNALDEQADLNMDDLRKFSRRFVMKTDVCARHGLRKVVTHNGRSWRCK